MSIKILIVDDEKPICQNLQALLEDEGYTVDIALSGPDAVNQVSENEYDIVFLDVLLPRMEGRQIFAEIKKIKDIPIVFMSGYLPPHVEHEVAKLGAKACMSKPLDLEKVKKLIESL